MGLYRRPALGIAVLLLVTATLVIPSVPLGGGAASDWARLPPHSATTQPAAAYNPPPPSATTPPFLTSAWNLSPLYQNQRSGLGGFSIAAWTSTVIAGAGGYAVVGGNGLVFYRNGTFASPRGYPPGYFRDGAWDAGGDLLAVGGFFGATSGAYLGLYDPSTNQFTNETHVLPATLAVGTSLSATAWNGSAFWVFGSSAPNSQGTTFPVLFSWNPGSGLLADHSGLLANDSVFENSSFVAMTATPDGIYLMTRNFPSGSVGFGSISTRGVFTDLSSVLPASFGMGTDFTGYYSPTVSPMAWSDGTLLLAGTLVDSLTPDLLLYTPENGTVRSVGSGLSGVEFNPVAATTVDGYFLIAGWPGVAREPIELVAVSVSKAQAYPVSNPFPFPFVRVSGMATTGNQSFVAGGPLGYPTFALWNLTPEYPVEFTETGLPTYANWSVSLAGTVETSTASEISFNETNGTFAYTVGSVPGYAASSRMGSITVAGAPRSLPIAFHPSSPSTYTMTFTQSGLPLGTTWGIDFNGTVATTVGKGVAFTGIPNGTYSWSALAVPSYAPMLSSGVQSVSGFSVSVDLTFSPLTLAEVSWETLGPTEIPNQTGSANLLGSGSISAFAADPLDPNIMYAAGGPSPAGVGVNSAAGMYKTMDAGHNWSRVVIGVPNPYVSSLWVDPANPLVVVAGTWYDGIYRSADGGVNWSLVDSAFQVSSLLMARGTLFAATETGVAASTNDGLTWAPLEPAPTNAPASMLGYGGGTLVVGTDGGAVLAWPNMTGPWSQILDVVGAPILAIAVNSSNPANVFVVAWSGYETAGLYKTVDGGRSWVVPSLPPVGFGNSSQFVLLTNSSRPKLFVGGEDGSLFVSANSGATFATLPLAVDARFATTLPNGSVVVGSDQGLFESDDNGTSWKSLSGSISASLLYGLAVNGSHILTSVQDYSPIGSFDSGASWTDLYPGAPLGEGGKVFVNPENASLWYAFTYYAFQYSTNGGRTFTGNSGVPPPPGGPGGNLIAVDPGNYKVVYVGTPNGVYVSHDGGMSFALESWPFTNVGLIAFAPSSNQTLFVGGENGSLYVTFNGGASWTQCSFGGAPSPGWATSVSVDPMNVSIVLVGWTAQPSASGGIWISRNGGLSFAPDNVGLSSSPGFWPYGAFVHQVAFQPNSSLVAAATSDGVYLSYPGQPWYASITNLTTLVDTGLAWQDGYLYASTYGEGVVRTAAPVVASISSVSFREENLPVGSNWSVTLANATQRSTADTITFMEPNGTYTFSVSAPRGYGPTPASATLTVSGRPMNVTITFLPVTYTVTFTETGLASGTSWSVSLNGTSRSSSTSSIVFLEPNGTYAYTVSSPGWQPSPGSGSVTINGEPASEMITFTRVAYTVTFTESGLPTGTSWSVTVNGTTLSSTASSIGFVEPNGTYAYSITPIAGYSTTYNGQVTVNGASVSESVTFTQVTYTVMFMESGLPSGTSWSVTLGGSTVSSTTSTITFSEPNGTYAYTIADVSGWHQTILPYSGSVMVNGASVTEPTLFFTQVTYTVTFTESGLPSGTSWSVTVSGTAHSSTSSTISFTEPNGTYAYSITDVPGWHQTTLPYSGSLTVNGVSVSEPTLVFAQVTYAVTFTESGLPSGTSWSVTPNGVAQSSTNFTITFSEANGTYSFSVGAVSGYTASPLSGSVTVNGAPETEAITFSAVPPGEYTVTFTETGLPSGTSWSVTLNGGTQSSTGSTILFREANGTYTYAVGTVSGYTVSPSAGTVTVNGVAQSQSITFASSTASSASPSFPWIYVVIGIVIAAVAAGVAVASLRRSRRR